MEIKKLWYKLVAKDLVKTVNAYSNEIGRLNNLLKSEKYNNNRLQEQLRVRDPLADSINNVRNYASQSRIRELEGEVTRLQERTRQLQSKPTRIQQLEDEVEYLKKTIKEQW